MASAILFSLPLTDSMSHKAAVTLTTSAPRSRRGTEDMVKDMTGRVSGGASPPLGSLAYAWAHDE